VIRDVVASFDRFDFSKGLETIWGLISSIDKLIVEQAPWKLVKSEDSRSQDALDETLYTAAETLRIVTALVYPVMPQAAEKIWRQLGMTEPLAEVKLADLRWGQLASGQSIGEIGPIFPRLDAKESIEKMLALEAAETARQKALFGKSDEPEATEAAQPVPIAPIGETISIDDFAKVDLRVGLVKHAEPLKGADKLLHLKVDIGEAEPRTILAGIAKYYKPEDLIGRKVVIVANLAPRKMRGIESQGMVVAASVEGGPAILAGFLEDIQPGARLK
jgi:methionyl-tRNA synthetase